MAENKRGLTYAQAGVDIDAGNGLVERIKPIVAATRRAGVLTGIGGFAACSSCRPASGARCSSPARTA